MAVPKKKKSNSFQKLHKSIKIFKLKKIKTIPTFVKLTLKFNK